MPPNESGRQGVESKRAGMANAAGHVNPPVAPDTNTRKEEDLPHPHEKEEELQQTWRNFPQYNTSLSTTWNRSSTCG